MKRMMGLLMMVGLMVGVVGCGDNDNPVKSYPVESYQDHLVGTWIDQNGYEWTLKVDGTFVDYDGDKGTWSLVGDQLTFAYDDPDLAQYGFTDTLISVTDTKLTVTQPTFEDGEKSVYTRKT